jgi:hypothetical protein
MSGTGLDPSLVSWERVGGEEAPGDEFLGELDLAGGKLGGESLGEGTVEELVVEELVGDLGEAVGGKDGNDEGEAVAGIIVRFRNHRGLALPELHLGLETGNPEVLGDVKVVQKDFLEGGLGFRRRIIAIATKLLQQLLH